MVLGTNPVPGDALKAISCRHQAVRMAVPQHLWSEDFLTAVGFGEELWEGASCVPSQTSQGACSGSSLCPEQEASYHTDGPIHWTGGERYQVETLELTMTFTATFVQTPFPPGVQSLQP